MRFGYKVFHPDVQVLTDFYVRVLGFEPYPDPRDDYQVVRRDGLAVGCSQAADADIHRRRPPHGSEIVLRVQDLDAEHARVLASGWPIADPLQRRPWGMTDFRLFDPSGQSIRITGPAETR